MRTFVYVDGFNLYYRLLQSDPSLKWLNILAMAQAALPKTAEIVRMRYFSARVSGRRDRQAPGRQQAYLNALATLPGFEAHMGNFLTSSKFAELAQPPEFRPRISWPANEPAPDVVKIIKTEEKGSDVNLASHLLMDSFRNSFEAAAVISNDADLIEPIRLATRELGKTVGLLTPVPSPNPRLREVASFVRHIERRHLSHAQFPDVIELPNGQRAQRPAEWR
ncbi:hypothetical protein CHU93_04285 [Sandarakinorhabdus cyanobacteriorum]|uniref:NYN domain-containing protein n=1 Tax=Sandarakinorhabdus cyanobacteriorum TaxID=1981098 RepID=A0A255YRI0_9SPHN|nr:NYN domain-containing protein [Sandarakinorhabdus cyanobacteriorum]OYQ31324.1 hypothetical protein CHU93_04285 [Sandarakinorhabdus cyanobacteriorum]